MAEISGLKSARKIDKRNREGLHDMVVRRLARYVEKEEENTIEIPTNRLKQKNDKEEFEDI